MYRTTTINFSHDDGTTTTAIVEVEYEKVEHAEDDCDEYVIGYSLPEDFKKEDHSDWKGELSEQLREDYGMKFND